MRHHTLLAVIVMALLAMTGLTSAQSNTPSILSFDSTLKGVDRTALTNRTARVPVSWTTANRPVLANLVFEQVLPDNSVINVELPRLFPWVNSDGKGVAAPILPTGNATSIRLRVRLVNLITQGTLDTRDLTLPISQDGSGSSNSGGNVPTITSFYTLFQGKINRNELSSNSARIPVAWTSVNRPLSATLVFEQVMPDGSLVNVELPRSTPWVNSSDKGMVAPRLPGGTVSEIRLRLRLIDLVYGRVLDQRDIVLPVDTGATQPPTINTFTTTRTSVTLDELRGSVRLPVTWEAVNRPANSNLVFEQVLANGQVRNAELPRDVVIVPSSGQGIVQLVDPGSTVEVMFRVRLVDLVSSATLAAREIRLPISNGGEREGYTIVTGDACYKTPFPPSSGVTVGQLARVASFTNNSSLALYKDKAPNFESIVFVNAGETVTVTEGPYCVINGNRAPFQNFRQWKVKTTAGNLIGWMSEYNGNQTDGFVRYLVSTSQTETTPEVVTFTVQPADKLDFNGEVTVTWEVRNATRVMLNIGSKYLGDQAASGTVTYKVKDIYAYNPTIFHISASDAQQNSADKEIIVPVDSAGLSITSFTVSPTTVVQGAPVTVAWEIAGTFAKAWVAYDKIENQMPISDLPVAANTGQGTITVGVNVSNREHNFTLSVQDANGVVITKDVKVTVTCANSTFFVSDPTNQANRCANPTASLQAAYQPFNGGFMIWKKTVSGYSEVLVFYPSGSFSYFGDWDGTPYQITDADPNAILPANSFGYVWTANPSVRSALGYPTAGEQGYTATFQSTAGYAKYDTTYSYLTLPDGRIIRYATNYGGANGWGFMG